MFENLGKLTLSTTLN